MGTHRTVADRKDINPSYGESFSDAVICVLELSLHDCGIYFAQDDSENAGQKHPKSMLVRDHDAGLKPYLRRPHRSGRKFTLIALLTKAAVPHAPVSANRV